MSGVARERDRLAAICVFLIFDAAGVAGRKSAGAAAMTRTSACGSSRSTAAAMSAVDSTDCTLTPGGGATLSGPATRSTLAPRRHAAAASATPILPLLWFEMNRTGSIASRVGPAVISTRLPRKRRRRAPADVRHEQTVLQVLACAPGPLPSPAASMPSSGSTIW